MSWFRGKDLDLGDLLVKFSKLNQTIVVKKLLKMGAIEQVQPWTGNALERACINGNIEIIKLLLESNPTYYLISLSAAKYYAGVYRQKEAADFLIEYEQRR